MNSLNTKTPKGRPFVTSDGRILYTAYSHCDGCEGNIYEPNKKTCDSCQADFEAWASKK